MMQNIISDPKIGDTFCNKTSVVLGEKKVISMTRGVQQKQNQ